MTKKEIIKRYLVLVIGLLFMALGVSFMVKAKLGTSPISSFPYVLSLKFENISLGTFTFAWNIVLIIGQILILRKDFKPIELMQIPISVIFGAFVDLTKKMIENLNPDTYLLSVIMLLLGCVILAFGVSLTVLSGVVLNSGEGFVKAVTIKTKKDFGNLKVIFDISLVVLAAITSVIFFGKIAGIREGTIIAACITGLIMKAINKKIKPVIDNFMIEDYSSLDNKFEM